MKKGQITIRFEGPLNDFLAHSKRRRRFKHSVNGNPTVGDTVESLGVPHTEIARLRVNYKRARIFRHLKNGDVITVWPGVRIPRRKPKFILDVHLGKLAKYLRLLGFDVLYKNDYLDRQIAEIAPRTRRLVLTRDVGLLKHKTIKWGYWLRNVEPTAQLQEVLARFSLRRYVDPFAVCLVCNGRLVRVKKTEIAHRLLAKTRRYYDSFYRCQECDKIYWAGSHYASMKKFMGDSLGIKTKKV